MDKPSIDDIFNKVSQPSGENAITKEANEIERIKQLEKELKEATRKLGGRPKINSAEKSTVRVNFYITPKQLEKLKSKTIYTENMKAKKLLLEWIEAEDEN
jgi:hypothetical protein